MLTDEPRLLMWSGWRSVPRISAWPFTTGFRVNNSSHKHARLIGAPTGISHPRLHVIPCGIPEVKLPYEILYLPYRWSIVLDMSASKWCIDNPPIPVV